MLQYKHIKNNWFAEKVNQSDSFYTIYDNTNKILGTNIAYFFEISDEWVQTINIKSGAWLTLTIDNGYLVFRFSNEGGGNIYADHCIYFDNSSFVDGQISISNIIPYRVLYEKNCELNYAKDNEIKSALFTYCLEFGYTDGTFVESLVDGTVRMITNIHKNSLDKIHYRSDLDELRLPAQPTKLKDDIEDILIYQEGKWANKLRHFLLHTEDGVSKYENDYCIVINKKFNIEDKKIFTKYLSRNEDPHHNFYYFNDKSLAEDFVVHHVKMFSSHEVDEFVRDLNHNNLIKDNNINEVDRFLNKLKNKEYVKT